MNKILQQPRNIFALDGVGAFISASLMGLLLLFTDNFFGIPDQTLFWLWLLPVAFCLFSLTQYALAPARWRIFLRVIAFANLTYCVLSLGLVLAFWDTVTPLGLAYLMGEKIIVVTLAIAELRWSKQLP